ncbi:cytochrome P450 [Trametopsis cervina]|nr:cytochrome P450 [Trametopsis cervina]
MSLQEIQVYHLVAGLAGYYAFNRHEPASTAGILTYLLAPPTLLSLLFGPQASSVFTAVTNSFTVYFAILAVCTILYRISPFHPLARYPGPLMNKITNWWTYYHVKDGSQHLYYQALHNKYGDVVRIGPNELTFRDASLITPMMGTTGFPKGPNRLAAAMYPSVPSMITMRDPSMHAKRRRYWSRGFGISAVKEYQPLVQKRVAQFVDLLESRQGSTIDLNEYINWLTSDIMGDMVFGSTPELLKNARIDPFWDILKQGYDMALLFDRITWLPYFAKYLPSMRRRITAMRGTGVERAMRRLHSGSKTKDLYYYLSNEDGSEKETPPTANIVSDGGLAMVAGSDTTSTVLTNAFWTILRYPEICKRLCDEVDKFYPAGDDATDPIRHPEMSYLEAVINETLRMYPVAPSGSQRAPTLGKGDRFLGEYYIPEGTSVRIHTWSIHHDPRNFTNPNTFWPDRWLIAEGSQHAPEGFVHNVNAFIPFSYGPSNCVGKNVAMQEMRTVLCTTLQRLRMELVGDPEEYQKHIKDKYVIEVGELPVLIKPRQTG